MEIENKIQFLDGAMGTQLQDKGLPAGASPELFMMEHGEIIEDVHAAYIDSGSDIIYTNTFGANAKKLCKSQYTVEEVITRAVQLAKSAAKRRNGVQVAYIVLHPAGDMKAGFQLLFKLQSGIFRNIIIGILNTSLFRINHPCC